MEENNSLKTTNTTSISSLPLKGKTMFGDLMRTSVRDEELRKLESDIKKAYVLKSLHAQLAEQEASRYAQEIQERINNEVERCLTAAQEEAQKQYEESTKHERETELRIALQKQITSKYEERQLLEVEQYKERQLLIELDRQRELRESREKSEQRYQVAEQLQLGNLLQREIRETNRCWLEEEELKLMNENDKYIEELDKRAKNLKQRQLEILKRREESIEIVARMLLELGNEREEHRQYLVDKMIEQVELEAEIEARQAEMRRQQQQRQLAQCLEEQIRFEEECRRRFLEREKKFAEAVMIEVMRSEKIKQLSIEARKRRQFAYRQQLENLIKERQQAREAQLVRIQAEIEDERRQKKTETELARKERILLLEQHVNNVADFLSKNSLYDEERLVLEKRSDEQKIDP